MIKNCFALGALAVVGEATAPTKRGGIMEFPSNQEMCTDIGLHWSTYRTDCLLGGDRNLEELWCKFNGGTYKETSL